MSLPLASAAAACSICGEPLNAKGDCLVCLLRTGLDKSVVETKLDTSFVFGDYELLEEIGRGGQAVVYRARQKSLNRIVALKVIGFGHWESTPHLKRFRHEAEAAARLEHPQIVPIYEIGERDGSCYFSMKFVEGGPLAEVLKRESMSMRRAAELLAKIARTVHYAHQHGILHRDIKPGNILLDRQGEPHLTDFGLARLLEQESTITHSSDVLGTPSYMSPEQAAGRTKELTAATDVYSLGAVFYQMLTGEPPFVGGTTYETIRLVLESEPCNPRMRNPKIDRDLSTICLKCLEKDPKRRYSSALALAEDLEHWLKHEPIQAQRTGLFGRGKRWVRRNPSIAVMAALLLALAVPLGVMIWKGQSQRSPASNPAVPDKSIAVLPFENRSEDKANAYFADGIQDEILTRLSKIADLKVISRTSMQHYKSTPENLPEIARQLGVAHILEGSVQKSGDTMRVNVQLIKAADDSHLWADSFDRKLTDILSVENEVAKAIAEQLRAKLTGQEEEVIAAKPTDNPGAYDAYLRGLAYTLKAVSTAANSLGAQKYLKEAVRLDPKFALAWALLSYADVRGYLSLTLQPTNALQDEAREAAETALTLEPTLGEALLAKGYYHYAFLRDYDTAVRYFEQARQFLPNSSRIPESLAYVARRRGQWDRSESFYKEAERLDPRNVNLLTQHAFTYGALRRFPEALRKFDQVLNVIPDDVDTLANKAAIAQAQGDLPRASALLAPLHLNANNNTLALEVQVYQAILERHPAQIITRLKEVLAKPDPALGYINGEFHFWLGWAQDIGGDHAAAYESWRQARSELESFLEKQPDNYTLMGGLALTKMFLGDKAAALVLSERAMAAIPIEKDAFNGPYSIEILARVAAQVGEPDRAISALRQLLSIPNDGLIATPLTPELLRLDPMFDPLRGDPRFEKLVEEAKQPVALSPSTPVREKSIAVLPFENLSNDREDASFADGVQDDLLTKLAKISDLRVISRRSVMQYRDQHNTRQIGDALRVSHVLEGSVRKTGAWLHINAQLIDTRTDTHVWAEQYDRDLKDMFAIQSEIAQKVAERLHIKISPTERQAIERPPTVDITAFDLYSRAKNFVLAWNSSSPEKGDLLQAANLLNQAVARDPTFFQAYCQLAWVDHQLYFFRFDRTPERLALAKAAIDTASRLRPDAGEAHLARAGYLYHGYLDYDGALAELETARKTLPNDPRLFELKGYIERRRPGGNQEKALRELERAIDLDPRNSILLRNIALSYKSLRRYGEEEAILDRELEIRPNDVYLKGARAFVDLDWKANTRPLHALIDSIRATNPVAMPEISDKWLTCALAERDAAAAANALTARGERSLGNELVKYSPRFMEGLIAQMKQDDARARSAFTAARAEQEKLVHTHPDDPGALCVLGLIDAALGRKEEALREGRRAVELLPVEKDVLNGTRMIAGLARIAASIGDKDLACKQLAHASRLPNAIVTYGQLKLLPWWDPLRGDPCFEKIVASLAPNSE